jgi:3-isopropylmalate/(R)-2-methylmalate dehydratase small subunit
VRIWKFGDNVNTDQITPGRYNLTVDSEKLARCAFIEIRPDFCAAVKKGDLIIAGRNFGCGSSRETAPLALKASGIEAIIANSFARIFYRNAVNLGLPVFVSQGIPEAAQDGDTGEIDLNNFTLKIGGKIHDLPKPPQFVVDIIRSGGIIDYLKSGGTLG